MAADSGKQSGGALRQFAEQRGLTFTDKAKLPGSTLLSMTAEAESTHIVSGDLPGFKGLLSAYTITKPASNSNSKPIVTETNVALTRVPESIRYIPSLTARDAKVRGFSERLVGAGGVIPIYDQLEFESIKFNTTYRVGVLKRQNESFVRQMFAPSFIDYLAEQAPEGCYFDLMFGVLMVAANKPLTTTEEIDSFCEFTARVADRVREECRESIELDTDTTDLVPEPVRKMEAARLEWVEKVRFDGPPENVKDASKPYRGFALRKPSTWLGSAVIAAILALMMAGIAAFFTVAWAGKYALFASLGVFALVFAWSFVVFLRGTVVRETVNWGLVAFARGYASQRNLKWEPGSQFATTHAHINAVTNIGIALEGRMPGTEREGTLLVSVNPDNKARKTTGNLNLVTELKGPESEALMLLPEGFKAESTALGGFLIEEAEGVHESEADRSQRERTEALGKQVLGNEDGQQKLGLILQGDDLAVLSDKMKALDWDAEALDSFVQRASATAERLEQSLAAP